MLKLGLVYWVAIEYLKLSTGAGTLTRETRTFLGGECAVPGTGGIMYRRRLEVNKTEQIARPVIRFFFHDSPGVSILDVHGKTLSADGFFDSLNEAARAMEAEFRKATEDGIRDLEKKGASAHQESRFCLCSKCRNE